MKINRKFCDGLKSLNAFLFVFDGDPEAFLQQRQLTNQVSDGVCEGFLLKRQFPLMKYHLSPCQQ